MKVSLKKAFSLLDGRLSTELRDVYEMLGYIFSANLYTHQIPGAFRELRKENPKWFSDGKLFLDEIKEKYGTNNFEDLMIIIDKEYSDVEIELNKIDKEIDFLDGLI